MQSAQARPPALPGPPHSGQVGAATIARAGRGVGAGSGSLGGGATLGADGAQGRGAKPAREARAAWSSASSKARTGQWRRRPERGGAFGLFSPKPYGVAAMAVSG